MTLNNPESKKLNIRKENTNGLQKIEEVVK